MPRTLDGYESEDRSSRATDDGTRDSPAQHPPPLVDRRYRSQSRWHRPVTRPERRSFRTDEPESTSSSTSLRSRGDTPARISADTNPSARPHLESSFAHFRARWARSDAAESDGSASVESHSVSQQASRDTLASQVDEDWVEVNPDGAPIRVVTHRTSCPRTAGLAVPASASTSASVSATASISSDIDPSASSASLGARTKSKSKSKTGTSSTTHSPSPPHTSPDLDTLTSLEEAKRDVERLRNDPNADIDELIATCVRYRQAKKRAGVDESLSTSGYLLSSDARRYMEQSEVILPILNFSQPIQPSPSFQPYQRSQINSPNPPSQPSHSQTGRTSLSSASSTSGSQRRSSGGTGSWEARKSPLRQVMSADDDDDDDDDDQSTGDLGLSAA